MPAYRAARGESAITLTSNPKRVLEYSTQSPTATSRPIAKPRGTTTLPSAVPSTSLSWSALTVAAAFFALLGFTVYRTTAGKIPSIGSRTRVADRSANVVTFQDVAGVDEAKDEVKEIVDFLREPQRFSAVGGRIPKGILLVGPPGTGKTLLARSIAGEAGVPFLFASGSDFVEMYAGVGA